MKRDAPTRRWPLLIGVGLTLLLVGAASAWAVFTVLRPADDPLTATEHTYVEVTRGEVGVSQSLNTIAEWTLTPAGVNQATGIVTSVDIEPGTETTQGAQLYSVALRPVVIAQGDVPMFRSITTGAEGEDVAQLQTMLAALGHYRGTTDGKVETETMAAIKRWQASLGLQKSGVVELGDVIFVPRLPARVDLDPEVIQRGNSLVGGEPVVRVLPAAPDFWVPATEAQAAMMAAGTTIEVIAPDGQQWSGITGEQIRDPDSKEISVEVTGIEGDTLCSDQCAIIPVSGQTSMRSTIVTVEQVTGLVVPSAAIITTGDGNTAVVDEQGNRVPVDIIASARGMSVVSGIDVGSRVQIPPEAEPAE